MIHRFLPKSLSNAKQIKAMLNRMLTLTCLGLFALTPLFLAAQDAPAPSPASEVSQVVGLTNVTIAYSRPGVKDRTIFAADGLVPYGEIWRTGANAATKITFDKDVEVGGEALSAGSYAILSKPGADSWEVMFFPYESGSWMSYTDESPAATVTVEAHSMDVFVETFFIDINNIRDDSATIDIVWENTYVSIPLSVD